ncbi:nuclear transport factor 2 family protein [Streptomyces sp. NPDC048436]|uniref:nuclear transport factor 2 family protein n=1 Tax=Streptomyces sp. NPDC048436 TaxID=3365550 RepID=UPI00372411EC
MTVDSERTPESLVSEFFNSYVKEVVFGSEDPQKSIDRFYTPDFVQIADGTEMNREQLAEHAPTAKQTFEKAHYEVHEAVHNGASVAARLTFHAVTRAGGAMDVDFYVFAELADDGKRVRRIHQLTRTHEA